MKKKKEKIEVLDTETCEKPKKKISKINFITQVLLIITLLTTLIGFSLIIYNNIYELKDNLFTILSSFIISMFIISFGIVSINNKKKNYKFLIGCSILLISFNCINTFSTSFALSNNDVIKDFTNSTITEALSWGKENNIEIVQTYEYSDIIKEYYVIGQDIKSGTNIKDITTINIIVSKGPDYNKEIVFPSIVGLSYDEVMLKIDEYLLNNVTIEFINSSEEKDIALEQSITGQMKRNDILTINFSRGLDDSLEPIILIDLKNMSLLKATSYLKRNNIDYELNYEFSKSVKKDYVISFDKEIGSTLYPNTDKIVLTISKGEKIIVPNIYKMTSEQLTNWIIDNNLKVTFYDKYDENIAIGYLINSSVKENDFVSQGEIITFTISKGTQKMPKFSTLKDFIDWAEKYDIKYEEEREFNDTVANGGIIKFSHEVGSVIKNDDTITAYISQGKAIIIPNFIGMNKSNITTKCVSLGLTCNFIYGSYNDTVKKDIATNQSKKPNSKTGESSSITITLSKGTIQKVIVPNFIGMNKIEIISKCKTLNLSYKFVIGSFNTNYASDVAYKQSIDNNKEVTQGTTITFTLSKGTATTYNNVVIQSNWFITGNSTSSIASMKSKLSSIYPKLTFEFITVLDDGLTSGIIHPSSSYKADTKYIMTEGNTYTIKVVK